MDARSFRRARADGAGPPRRGALALALAAILALAVPGLASAGYVNYPTFMRTGGLELNGSATAMDNGQIRLTDDFSEAGSFFTSPGTIDTGQPIHTSFKFNLHDGSGQADGFTFTIQRDPAGADALGGGGGSLGYGENFPASGIQKSVAVAFDIYGGQDVSFYESGDMTNEIAEAPAALVGGDRYGWVDYSPAKRKLTAYVSDTAIKPAAPTTSTKLNLAKIVGSKPARAGFTGGTGGEYTVQDISSWKVNNP